jgi:ribosomal protein L21E
MRVGDLVRYTNGDDGYTGIVVHTEQDGYAVEIEWIDGERHVYFEEHQRYLEVVCK